MTADTISAQINRISNNIEMAYSALLDKGATMPATNNSALLADTINTISGGGGGGSDEIGKYMIVNGVAQKQAGDIDGRLTGITSVSDNGLSYAFQATNLTGDANLCNCVSIGYSGMASCFSGTNVTSMNFASLSTINYAGLDYAFNNCINLTGEVLFPNLVSITNDRSFYMAFTNCQNLTGNIIFNKLTDIANGSYGAFMGAFSNCYNITGRIDFSNLVNVGRNSFINAFSFLPLGYGQPPSFARNAEVNFSSIVSLSNYGCFENAFSKALRHNAILNFNNLQSVTGMNAFSNAFSNCNLANVSFPSLTDIGMSNQLTISDYLSNTFARSNFQSLSMPNLTNVYGNRPLGVMCQYSSVEDVDMSGLSNVDGNLCFMSAFAHCNSINKVFIGNTNSTNTAEASQCYINIFNLNGNQVFGSMFTGDTFNRVLLFNEIDFESEDPPTPASYNAFSYAFQLAKINSVEFTWMDAQNHTGLFRNAFRDTRDGSNGTNMRVILPAPDMEFGEATFENCFRNSGVSEITIDLSSGLSMSNTFRNMFADSPNLTTIEFTGSDGFMAGGSNIMTDIANNTPLTTVSLVGMSFDMPEENDFDTVFAGMLNGTNGVTVLLPVTFQTVIEAWASYQANFGGTNVTMDWQ